LPQWALQNYSEIFNSCIFKCSEQTISERMWKDWKPMRKQRIISGCAALALLMGLYRTETLPANAPVEIPTEQRYIAMTFDDGPRRATTERLLNGLRDRGASATFFLVGKQIAGNEDLVKRMFEEGHQVGNHTWDHVSLQESQPEKIAWEIKQTETQLQAILGERSYWLRPPYGKLSEKQRKQIQTPLVQWSIDPEDWKYKNTEKVVQSVLKAAKPNAIILLHDIYPTSVDAALQIVDALQEKGYVFVTVEELLALNKIEPEPGVFYLHG
jgi:peptidoglycan/xylan/chitin deacetylase (PgdA/CDA1 family)